MLWRNTLKNIFKMAKIKLVKVENETRDKARMILIGFIIGLVLGFIIF